jgi:hypothetical protein
MAKNILLIFSLLLFIGNSFASASKKSADSYKLFILGLYINNIYIGDNIVYLKKKICT